VMDYAGSGTDIYQSTSSTSYTQLSVPFTTSSGVTSVRVYFWTDWVTAASGYGDDFQLTVGGG